MTNCNRVVIEGRRKNGMRVSISMGTELSIFNKDTAVDMELILWGLINGVVSVTLTGGRYDKVMGCTVDVVSRVIMSALAIPSTPALITPHSYQVLLIHQMV